MKKISLIYILISVAMLVFSIWNVCESKKLQADARRMLEMSNDTFSLVYDVLGRDIWKKK